MASIKTVSLLILLSGIIGCTKTEKSEITKTQEVYIDSLYTFVDFENHSIASPTTIQVLNNGLVTVADYSTQTISIVDSTGILKTKFGRQGRGPGDFLNILQIYDIGEKVVVFDSHLNRLSYFDYDGAFLSSTSLPSETMNKEFQLINDTSYVISMDGRNNKLLQLRSLNTDNILSFGEPKITEKEEIDMIKSQNQLKAGITPDIFKNKVMLRTNKDHIYVFFEALSEMRKYDLQGNLIWEKKIMLPNNKKIFNETVEQVKNHKSSRSIPSLSYIWDFQISNNFIYILTSKAKGQTQKIVKLSSKGRILIVYDLPNNDRYKYDLSLDTARDIVYLSSWSSSLVLSSPLNL